MQVFYKLLYRDIKKLDIAKKHLSKSTTALEQLQMLVNSLDELDQYYADRDYEKAAKVIGAVNQFSAIFLQYESVHKIHQIEERVRDIKNKFGVVIMADFSEVERLNADFIDKDDKQYHELLNLKNKLKNAALVMDYLDKNTRMTLINKFVTNQLKDYENLFYPGVGKQQSTFAMVERRFHYFKKILGTYFILILVLIMYMLKYIQYHGE